MKDATPKPKSTLTFGIYPGSAIGDTELTGPPDRPDKINQALAQLQGSPGRPFIVRAYDIYADPGDTVHAITLQTPAGYDRYLGHGRTLDLVVQYHSRSGDVEGYCAFIEKLIDNHGGNIATLQIGEEANISDNPSLDGAFFASLTRAGGERFIEDLDYIGLDFFPDVFRPIAPANLGTLVQALLKAHRRDNLATAGLGHLPLVITEHGWPTGPGRTKQRQAEVLRTVIDVIARNAEELGIAGLLLRRRRAPVSVRADDRQLQAEARLPRLP